jgi:hypothetical protein
MKLSQVSFLVCAVAFVPAHAEEIVTDPKKMHSILSRIPVTDKDFGYKNIGERLPQLGMTIERISISKIGKGEEEPPDFKLGDEVIDVFLSAPNGAVKSVCPIAGGRTTYVIRGKKVIPLSRTGYWLMTNRCDFKG